MKLNCLPHAIKRWHLVLAGGALLLSACASSPPPSAAPARPPSFWRAENATGPRKIVIDLTAQQAKYYKGGELVGLSPISSGSDQHPTPRGSFRVTEKDIDHRSSCYGAYVDPQTHRIVVEDVDNREDRRPEGTVYKGAKMHYFMRFNGGIGMHEGYLPGYPASHGCVRLPTRMARLFFNETPHGTPVIVTGNASFAGPQVPVPLATAPAAVPTTAPATSPPPTTHEAGFLRRKAKPQPVPRGQTLYLY